MISAPESEMKAIDGDGPHLFEQKSPRVGCVPAQSAIMSTEEEHGGNRLHIYSGMYVLSRVELDGGQRGISRVLGKGRDVSGSRYIELWQCCCRCELLLRSEI